MKKFIGFALFFLSLLLLCSCSDKNDIIKDFNSDTFTGKADGCSSFFVNRFNNDNNLAIYVRGDRDDLGIDQTMQSFDLSATSGLDVQVEQFDGSATDHYCNDAIDLSAPSVIHSWEAMSGTVHIQITEDSINVSDFELTYKISIDLENIEVYDEDGNIEIIESATFTDVLVGWSPG